MQKAIFRRILFIAPLTSSTVLWKRWCLRFLRRCLRLLNKGGGTVIHSTYSKKAGLKVIDYHLLLRGYGRLVAEKSLKDTHFLEAMIWIKWVGIAKIPTGLQNQLDLKSIMNSEFMI